MKGRRPLRAIAGHLRRQREMFDRGCYYFDRVVRQKERCRWVGHYLKKKKDITNDNNINFNIYFKINRFFNYLKFKEKIDKKYCGGIIKTSAISSSLISASCVSLAYSSFHAAIASCTFSDSELKIRKPAKVLKINTLDFVSIIYLANQNK